MRTIKVTYDCDIGSGNRGLVSTEVIVDEDSEAEEAGRAAHAFVMDFNQGLSEAADRQ